MHNVKALNQLKLPLILENIIKLLHLTSWKANMRLQLKKPSQLDSQYKSFRIKAPDNLLIIFIQNSKSINLENPCLDKILHIF